MDVEGSNPFSRSNGDRMRSEDLYIMLLQEGIKFFNTKKDSKGNILTGKIITKKGNILTISGNFFNNYEIYISDNKKTGKADDWQVKKIEKKDAKQIEDKMEEEKPVEEKIVQEENVNKEDEEKLKRKLRREARKKKKESK